MIGNIISAIGGLAFIAIGVAAIVAPRGSSGQYGLATTDATALAFVRALGVRDVVLGLIVLALLVDGQTVALTFVLAISILAAAGDALTVLLTRRDAKFQTIGVHVGGGVALAIAWALVRAGW